MHNKNNDLGLTDDEIAFYDTLKAIAIELTRFIKANLKVDWYDKESARAAMRISIKRLLKKYDYPPKGREKALDTVLRQVKLMCEEMVA
ncbi:type I restriction enzyme endonuclease domain-containing protein [uncultured Ilyobacter sp.]|uniref:type I restriction enzyme endonuclease domain-containing protein n=1 Tax=uncultured Ilyobacter sp. TaxID=544433 RepID=UPI0029F49778|nr:type I restriction enzyme endonuclease domain-containing protein [uncultured Ilyobacter sp.]